MSSIERSRMAVSCSRVMAMGFSCEYPCTPISCPASTIIRVRSGKVSIEWPGTNQVAGRLYFSNSRMQPRAADLAAEQAAGDIAGRVLAPVGAEHAGHCVHVHAERDLDVLSHEITFHCFVEVRPEVSWVLEVDGSQEACPSGRRPPRSASAGVPSLSRRLSRTSDWDGRAARRDGTGSAQVLAAAVAVAGAPRHRLPRGCSSPPRRRPRWRRRLPRHSTRLALPVPVPWSTIPAAPAWRAARRRVESAPG